MINSKNSQGLIIIMETLQTATTIRVTVPNQEFASILLVVSGETILSKVHKEVRDQLSVGKHRYSKNTTCLVAYKKADTKKETPLLLMSNWSIERAQDFGISEFELIYTDMCQ